MISNNFKGYKVNPLISILILIVVLAGFFLMVRSFWIVAKWIMPILLIATLFIDYKVFIQYAQKIGKKFKADAFNGILWALGSILFSPILAIYLFGKALFSRKVKGIQKEMEKRDGEYVPFEEVETINLDDFQKKIEKNNPKNTSKYDDFF